MMEVNLTSVLSSSKQQQMLRLSNTTQMRSMLAVA